MMRSMFTGVSGLRVHQTRMDVIANNVANVNTIGFKTARATFQDAFYQNLAGATAANPDVGRTGTNPQQIGLGLSMGSIDNIMTQGAAQRTDFGMDIMIQNEGMFIVEDQSGRFFTRAGNITKDARGNLGVNGMQLMGWDVEQTDDGHWQVNRSILQPLSMSGNKANMPSEPTTVMELAGNLNARDVDSRNQLMRTMTIFDSLGNRYTVDVRFTLHNGQRGTEGPGAGSFTYWTFDFLGEFTEDGEFAVHAWLEGIRTIPGQIVNPALISVHVPSNNIDDTGYTIDRADMMPFGTLRFNTLGELVGMGPVEDVPNPDNWLPRNNRGFSTPIFGNEEDIDDFGSWLRPGADYFDFLVVPFQGAMIPAATLGRPGAPGFGFYAGFAPPDPPDPDFGDDGTAFLPIGTLRFDMTNFFARGGMNTNIGFEPIDGNAPGTLRDISIGSDGTITGMFTNGRLRVLGQIPVAIFANPAGLQRMGSNLWAATANSGGFDGIGEIGDIRSGALEMSNVDLAEEFTGMIITQRGFQASSRLISVSDEMIQELVNLRR
ncbi:MAG: flagellar hook protein FlgE [Defluviitaleaceae bacterium]|nr:flagellar hook protein FlgE [Defluviitaleaceae bacterium]MCL2240442.1 flagellar hook protein FlgE [Defluviitaleaceae bacterium]